VTPSLPPMHFKPALLAALLLAAWSSAGAQGSDASAVGVANTDRTAALTPTQTPAQIQTQAQTQTQTQARALLAAGQAGEAQTLLAPLVASGNADSQTLFLAAMAAKAQGDWQGMKIHLNALLAQDPAAGGRVKLELAEALYRSGEPIRARQLLNEVKASNPPPKVGENIDAFLAFIQSGTPSLFSGWASVGRLHDSNANQGPDIDTVLMYNLPFTLDKDARGNSDWATVLRAGGNVHYAVNDKLALQAGVSLHSTDYDRLNRFDVLSTSFNAGPSYKVNGLSFSLPYVLNMVKIGHSEYKGDWYQISNGVAPQFGWQVNPRVSVQGSLAWQNKRYRNNAQRNGKALTFSPSVRVGIDARSYATAGGYVGRETSGIQTSANDSHGIHLSYYRALSQNWNVYVSPSWSQTDYDGIEAAYGKGRKDERWDATANVNYTVPRWGVNMTLSYTYTHNHSSIPMYQYKREQAMVSVAKSF